MISDIIHCGTASRAEMYPTFHYPKQTLYKPVYKFWIGKMFLKRPIFQDYKDLKRNLRKTHHQRNAINYKYPQMEIYKLFDKESKIIL